MQNHSLPSPHTVSHRMDNTDVLPTLAVPRADISKRSQNPSPTQPLSFRDLPKVPFQAATSSRSGLTCVPITHDKTGRKQAFYRISWFYGSGIQNRSAEETFDSPWHGVVAVVTEWHCWQQARLEGLLAHTPGSLVGVVRRICLGSLSIYDIHQLRVIFSHSS